MLTVFSCLLPHKMHMYHAFLPQAGEQESFRQFRDVGCLVLLSRTGHRTTVVAMSPHKFSGSLFLSTCLLHLKVSILNTSPWSWRRNRNSLGRFSAVMVGVASKWWKFENHSFGFRSVSLHCVPTYGPGTYGVLLTVEYRKANRQPMQPKCQTS